MGFCVNIKDIVGKELNGPVTERVLLKPEDTGKGPPGKLEVRHYVLKKGGVIELSNDGVERQDFIISGSVFFRNRYIHGNTTIFSPSGSKVKYHNDGETEARIISTVYSVPRPSHRWAKTRVSTLTEDYEEQLMTEEFHALTGAHRFHAIDIQTWDREPHTNPEETAYILRGKGVMRVDDQEYSVEAGSLVYAPEGAIHGIKNTGPVNTLQYYVMEYTEQDKMWSQRMFEKV
jgi:mannose-6-phosphate isomerase-like protein (cupin superfamily)